MKTRIVFLFMLMFLVTSFVNAKTNIQQILMSHPWYEELPPGFEEARLSLGWDEVPRTGFDFGKDSVRAYLFGQKDPVGAGISLYYPYYLSDTPPDETFDKDKVGKKTNGKYLIMMERYEGRSGHTLVYELVDIDTQHIKSRLYNLKSKGHSQYETWRPRP